MEEILEEYIEVKEVITSSRKVMTAAEKREKDLRPEIRKIFEDEGVDEVSIKGGVLSQNTGRSSWEFPQGVIEAMADLEILKEEAIAKGFATESRNPNFTFKADK